MPKALCDFLRCVTTFDFAVMFGYRGFARPIPLFDDFTPDRNDLHVADYVEGPYLLDPFFIASFAPARTGLWRMSDVAPDRFFQSEYYESYYKRTGLAEEIAFLVQAAEAVVVVVSLMRLDKRFSAPEMRKLAALWPIVEAACRQQWVSLPPAADSAGGDPMVNACRRLGDGALTDREGEVAALTLQGHSATAIGKALGISAGTARIHRQNIYAKLRIGSQSALFEAFQSLVFPPEPSRVHTETGAGSETRRT